MPLMGASPLDAPPPSPALEGGGPAQMNQLAPPVPTQGLPPEVLTGLMAAGQKVSEMIDSFAQVTPDLANEWGMIKTLLTQTLGKVLVAGAQATSPTNPGPQFPGGGLDRGPALAGVAGR